jgi:uncharacterized protein (DUF2267 family)
MPPNTPQLDLTLRDALPVLAALAGAIVGGAVAEFRTLLQGARERRRALKTLLHQLLELRFTITTQDPRQLLPALIAYLKRKVSPEQVREFEASPAQQLLHQVFDALTTTISDSPIAAQYHQAVSALAPHDPVLAYHLSNQARLPSLEHELRQYYAKVVTFPQLAQDTQAVLLLARIESASLDLARSEALDQLAENIGTVASKISLWTRYRATRIVRRQDDISGVELERILDQFMQTVMQRLGEQGAA